MHLHLDCSLSYAVVNELKGGISLEEYQSKFVAPDKCLDLADYIRRTESGCALMQTASNLKKVTRDLLDQLKEDHIVYAEIRFAPLLHTAGGLSSQDVVRAVLQELNNSKESHGVHTGLILCTLRHFTEEESLETADLVREFYGQGVVALDLAADEANFPIDNHIKAFERINSLGIPATAHAGEAKGWESVQETLKLLKPKRIGHGVRSIENKELVRELIDKNIHLEICPTSNIQVDVFDTIGQHPVDELFRKGISVGINTDGRAVSGISLSEEYFKVEKAFGWGYEEFKKCNLDSIRHSFASEVIKSKIIKELILHYENY